MYIKMIMYYSVHSSKAYSESTIDRWFTAALKVLDEQLPDGQTFLEL